MSQAALVLFPLTSLLIDRCLVLHLRTYNDNAFFDRINHPFKRVLFCSAILALVVSMVKLWPFAIVVNGASCSLLGLCYLTGIVWRTGCSFSTETDVFDTVGRDAHMLRAYKRHFLAAQFMIAYIALLTGVMWIAMRHDQE